MKPPFGKKTKKTKNILREGKVVRLLAWRNAVQDKAHVDIVIEIFSHENMFT